jgi:hypothetical protein
LLSGTEGSNDNDSDRREDSSIDSSSDSFDANFSDTVDNDKKLEAFSKKVSKLAIEELDRDLAEAKIDIDFLQSQIKADLGSYSPEELQRAEAKILFLQRTAEIIENELSRKKKDSLT